MSDPCSTSHKKLFDISALSANCSNVKPRWFLTSRIRPPTVVGPLSRSGITFWIHGHLRPRCPQELRLLPVYRYNSINRYSRPVYRNSIFYMLTRSDGQVETRGDVATSHVSQLESKEVCLAARTTPPKR